MGEGVGWGRSLDTMASPHLVDLMSFLLKRLRYGKDCQNANIEAVLKLFVFTEICGSQ